MKHFYRIDISGNWHEGKGFDDHIILSEPDVPDDHTKCFEQRLCLNKGRYRFILEYDSLLDRKHGRTINYRFDDFKGLVINGVQQTLLFSATEKENVYRASVETAVEKDSDVLILHLNVCNTRPLFTYLEAIDSPLKTEGSYYGILPENGGELLTAHGVPFITQRITRDFIIPGFYLTDPPNGKYGGGLIDWRNGVKLKCHFNAKTIHFLGMIHNIDVANGSWYNVKGDNGYSHFVGDTAGKIILKYADGNIKTIPLIFGYNIWYCVPWDMVWHYQDNPYSPGGPAKNFDKNLFCGMDEYREILKDGLGLVDAVRSMAAWRTNVRFIFSVDIGGKDIDDIEFCNVPDMYDYPIISAVTVESDQIFPGNDVACLPAISADIPNIKPVPIADIENMAYIPKIENIKRLLYTYVDDKPKLDAPEKPQNYYGPEYCFKGTDEACYAASFLHFNGPECAAYICDTGTGCSSSTAKWALNHYMFGTGIWIERKPRFDGIEGFLKEYATSTPGNFPGGNNAWTRGIGELLREAVAFGYDKFATQYIEWLDNCLFEEANPPHWNRIAGSKHACQKVQVGDIEEIGNRENDGHGICMWGRYMVWHWLGEDKAWNEGHWKATKAAAEWIEWQLDVDTIYPGQRKDVLFTDSECAHNSYDIYSTYNCLHGLRLSVKMAKQLGKVEEAERWTRLYERLAQGILDNLIDETEFGSVFHTEYDTDWQEHAHKLVHLQLATDGDTFTPLEDYMLRTGFDKKFMEIDINTYRYLTRNHDYNCIRMYGYGQGMMTQSALLLDRMYDAEQFINMLVNHCYLPKFGKWTCPEGVILHKSGKYYVPVNGYMGQDAHVADSTKALRIMLGVDDNDMNNTKLVPRYPLSWNSMEVKDFPVLIGNRREKVSYKFIRGDITDIFNYSFSRATKQLSIRLGPFTEDTTITAVSINGTKAEFEKIKSGDSVWIWLRNIKDQNAEIIIYKS